MAVTKDAIVHHAFRRRSLQKKDLIGNKDKKVRTGIEPMNTEMLELVVLVTGRGGGYFGIRSKLRDFRFLEN